MGASQQRIGSEMSDLKIPDIRLPDINDKINFCAESYKLSQANTLLTEMIKEMLL